MHTKFVTPFEPLELAVEDEAQLEDLAHLFVQNNIQQYENYLHQHHRTIDKDRWKLIKRKDNVYIYAERRGKDICRRYRRRQEKLQDRQASDSCTGSSTIASSGSSSSRTSSCRASSTTSQIKDAERPRRKKSNPSLFSGADLPVMLMIGTIDGTLEDVMYGAVSPTTEAMRVKTAYIDDYMVDGAILSTIVTPVATDPFRMLSVKWVKQRPPFHLRSLAKDRDLVFLESTGMSKLPSGEEIGYQLLHSVHFPQTHALPRVLRGNMSICALYRQHTPKTVDVFVKGYLSSVCNSGHALEIKLAAYSMVPPWMFVPCARMKKLAWAVQQGHSCDFHQIDYGGESGRNRAIWLRKSDPFFPQTCGSCERPVALFCHFSLVLGGRRTCKICGYLVCRTCRRKKQLQYVSARTNNVEQHELTFCTVCIHHAMIQTSALDVASDEHSAIGSLAVELEPHFQYQHLHGRLPQPEVGQMFQREELEQSFEDRMTRVW